MFASLQSSRQCCFLCRPAGRQPMLHCDRRHTRRECYIEFLFAIRQAVLQRDCRCSMQFCNAAKSPFQEAVLYGENACSQGGTAALRMWQHTGRESCIAFLPEFRQAVMHRVTACMPLCSAASSPCTKLEVELHRVLACRHAGSSASSTCLHSVWQWEAGPCLKSGRQCCNSSLPAVGKAVLHRVPTFTPAGSAASRLCLHSDRQRCIAFLPALRQAVLHRIPSLSPTANAAYRTSLQSGRQFCLASLPAVLHRVPPCRPAGNAPSCIFLQSLRECCIASFPAIRLAMTNQVPTFRASSCPDLHSASQFCNSIFIGANVDMSI